MRFSSAKSIPLVPVIVGACLALSLFAGPVQAADTVHPAKMSKARNRRRHFRGLRPRGQHPRWQHHARRRGVSHGEWAVRRGLYRSGKVRAEINEPYGVHEYMHFLEGGVTLTSSDGTVTEIKAGDSVVIPAEWTGVWDTDGYTKIYVIYSPDKPIE